MLGSVGELLIPAGDDDLAHWCPGCKKRHILPWKRGGWTFNGDHQRPTFMPSFLHRWHEWTGPAGALVATEKVCHYILASGVLAFCSDSTHPLANQSVPLPPMPEDSSWA